MQCYSFSLLRVKDNTKVKLINIAIVRKMETESNQEKKQRRLRAITLQGATEKSPTQYCKS